MFYDDLAESFKKSLQSSLRGPSKDKPGLEGLIRLYKGGKVRSKDRKRISVDKNKLLQHIKSELSYYSSVASVLDELSNYSKLFLIDGAVADTLYNEKHGNVNYEDSIRLPFQSMFFEFSDPLEVQRHPKSKNPLRTIIFRKEGLVTNLSRKSLRKFSRTGIRELDDYVKEANKASPGNKGGYSVSFFYSSESPDIGDVETIMFATSNLPSFALLRSDHNIFTYDATKGEAELSYASKGEYVGSQFLTQKTNTKIKRGDRRLTGPLKLLDLSLNLINYINAQNVEVTSHTKFVMGAGTGEERTVDTKKPYHWVTVKKTYVGEKSEPSGEGEGRTLEYRVWVRGHFRHYQSGLCIWIDPHVRGPSYAPWKHNRYKVLYENTIKPYEEMTKKT